MPKENNSREPALEINRSHVLNRYWELARLDSEVTKGNITGQLKALGALREELALAPVEKPSSPVKHTRSQEVYRSGWMGKS
jgi:hypothetical protein